MSFRNVLLLSAGALLTALVSCRDKDGDINIFSIQDDLAFGAQVSAEFEKDSAIVVLDSAKYAAQYAYLYKIRNQILNSGQIVYKSEFPWRVRIIRDDSVLNAFCTPGGYIYFYTGILKYLESEDQLAGVMGHEMAHADKRHSTDAMTREFGLSVLFDIVFGRNKGQLVRIVAGLKQLQYSREAESEADDYSVTYLCPSTLDAAGAAGFFEKLLATGSGSNVPQFLSTHPSPENRVQRIKDRKTTLGCTGTDKNTAAYTAFKNTLP
ncbi:MAG: M48 family metalloprotease [Bacteroidetes bacterium]|nr:M48 family metalloprotease [Bacteroidota bacterium]